MEGGEEQNTSSPNGTPQTSRSSRPPQIAHMSLYERQAVQALQALQRQPNAAHYFQQLMLQQQINNAQLHNLAAVQQVNLSTTTAGGTVTSPRPHGPATSATNTTLNQSVLLGGNSAGQGQMYLRVNRSLRAPLAPQLIFMPGGTATATVATVAQTQQQQQQQQQQPQQQQHEKAAPTPAVQSDSDQVQNLALHSSSRAVTIKSEFPERKDSSSFSVSQQPQQQSFAQTGQQTSHQQQAQSPPQQQLQQHLAKSNFPQQLSPSAAATSTGNQAAMSVTPTVSVASSTSTSTAVPISQLLLSSSAPVILVPTTNVATSSQGYTLGSVTAKANVNSQTLMVQPLQSGNSAADKGPVPIQPKTGQGHRLPAQLPPRHPHPILPAPPKNNVAVSVNPPHIPVQLVGARHCVAGGAQAVALVQTRSVPGPENVSGGTTNTSSSSNNNTTTKSSNSSLKRKSESETPNEEESDPAPTKDSAPPLSPAPNTDSAPVPVSTFSSSPPTLSLPVPPVPQAVVKPQVLTHVIEGFVIQEGAVPFPVAGLMKDRDFAMVSRSENRPPLLQCEYCHSFAPASQFRGSKRFCTNTCAKRYNVSCRVALKNRNKNGPPVKPPPPPSENKECRRVLTRKNSAENKISSRRLPVKWHSESSRSNASTDADEDEDNDSPPLTPTSHSRVDPGAPKSNSPTPAGLPMEGREYRSPNPAEWSVDEVFRFISSLQGCEDLAAHFLSQEIDGQALMLLREDHLISTMNIKLGPALKICAFIKTLRE